MRPRSSSTRSPSPANERHGRPRDLFTIWFSSNIMPLTFVTGALAPVVFKLPFGYSVVAILLGNLVGALFMALHSAQGPRLGVPQMIQSRGQFRMIGAVLVIAIAVFMYVGFFASNIILGGQSINVPTSAGPIPLAPCWGRARSFLPRAMCSPRRGAHGMVRPRPLS